MFTTKAKLKKGDQLEFGSNGGGGYGLPWERKVESVLDDVIDGLLSIEKARDVYGVAITEVDADALVYEVDEEETERLRAELAKDERPRGVGPFEVNPLGEKLFRGPGELGTTRCDGVLKRPRAEMAKETFNPEGMPPPVGPYSNVVASAPGPAGVRGRPGRLDAEGEGRRQGRRRGPDPAGDGEHQARPGGGRGDLRRRGQGRQLHHRHRRVPEDGGGPRAST